MNEVKKAQVGDTVQLGACVGTIRELDGDNILKFDLQYVELNGLVQFDENTFIRVDEFKRMIDEWNTGE